MKLLALNCPQCHQPLTPENDHLITVCQECLTAVELADEGLRQIDLHYASTPDESRVQEWRPFWIFKGRVHLLHRDTQGWGESGQAAEDLWGQPRQFYIPAWDLALRTAQEVGSLLVQQQPVYQAGPQPTRLNLLPIVVSAEDALKLAEFIVLAIEARRDDWLKDLDFRLELGPGVLWAVPVVR